MANLKKKIIIGTWSLTDQFGKINSKTIEETIDYAIKKNFNEFDTAPNYGNGEIELILSNFKKNFYPNLKINTKFGNSKENIKSFATREIIKSIDNSLKLFGKINTLYIHNPRCSEKKINKILDILFEYKKNKNVENIGISIARDFYYNKKILNKFDYIQDEVNVLFFKNLNNLKNLNPNIIARSPLASGCLSGKLNINKKFETQDYRKNWVRGKRLENILKQISIVEKIFGLNIKTISKSFVFFNPHVKKIIFGIRNKKHINELFNETNSIERLDKRKLYFLELVANSNYFLDTNGY